jgi:hypothetical protein
MGGMDLSHLAQNNNELPDFVKCLENLDWLSD